MVLTLKGFLAPSVCQQRERYFFQHGSLFLCSTKTGCLTATRFLSTTWAVQHLWGIAAFAERICDRLVWSDFEKGLVIDKWSRFGCITFEVKGMFIFIFPIWVVCLEMYFPEFVEWCTLSIYIYWRGDFELRLQKLTSFFADWAPLVINKSPCNSNLSSLFNLTGAPYHQNRGAAYFWFLENMRDHPLLQSQFLLRKLAWNAK